MKIKDILQRDPVSHPLVNQGQARISDDDSERTRGELRGELTTFVCEGQYADGIQKIIRSFLDSLNRTSQRGAWVSGFYGSGKSHLLKMLCHLWQDTAFADGTTARNMVPSIPEDLRALLRELDTAGRRSGGLLAAAGALPSGTMDNVRLTILAVLLRAVGLPEQYPQARFCLWLHSSGKFDNVKAAVETEGKLFERELNNLYVSGSIARAVMVSDPTFASTESEAKQLLRAQFAPQAADITTEEFLRTAKSALHLFSKDGRLPCTLLVLDEVQQYIGQSNDRSVLVTEVAEAISKQLDSHVIIVGAGQSALTDVPLLAKLMDRFTIRVPLSDADVETVTRRVLLQKKPSEVAGIRNLLDRHAGEVSRQLQGTRIGETGEDRSTIVDDYPLLPVRRRFWEDCFRQIDAAGTKSALRSQLQLLHQALTRIANLDVGSIITGEVLYEQLTSEMLSTGVLLREIHERIVQVGRTEGRLAERICGLVFLVGKLRRESGVDIGVRATKEHLADLLIDDLAADNGKVRAEIDVTLKRLSDQGTLMLVGDEFRLQTREGSEWDREFRNRQTKMNSDDAAIQFKRDQLLYGEVDQTTRGIRMVQGAAKESRQLVVYRDRTAPPADAGGVPIWIRDGWSCAEKEVTEGARAAGTDSPIVFVFIPRHSAEDLRRLIVESEAAQQTLDARGHPTTAEGQEARRSMESRRARATIERDRVSREIICNARVYQGGGSEVLSGELDNRIRTAAEVALIRLFPRFKEADSAAWAAVIRRARDGADQPFQPTGHTEATERHPVCQQVLSTIGAGNAGTDIRKALSGAPFGWPRDATDAGLISLHRLQHITATLNGQVVLLGQLDQNRIAKTEFRVEHATLSVDDRLVLRKLFQRLGMSCKSGEELARAGEFLTALITLGRMAGGEPPISASPDTKDVENVQRLVGNEQLVAIKNHAVTWTDKIGRWTAARDLIAQRLPTWSVVEHLARHATPIAEARPYIEQVAAIRDQRLLLEPSDPGNAIRIALSAALRDALQRSVVGYDKAFAAAMVTLESNDVWTKVPVEDRRSIEIVVGLAPAVKPLVANDEDLADHLDLKPLAGRQAEIDAIPGRVALAIERAAQLLEPGVQTVILERTTLRDVADVDAWLERQRIKLSNAVVHGPVLVS